MTVNHTIDILQIPDGGSRRAALYLHSACAPQVDPCSALEAQRRVLLDAAARHNLELVAEYRDIPASGQDAGRPNLGRLLDDVRHDGRSFDIVLVESPSRLSRQAAEMIEIALRLTLAGVQLYRADLDCFSFVASLEGPCEEEA